jgi:alpha-tubulin suppressor-like RCC1 family protein
MAATSGDFFSFIIRNGDLYGFGVNDTCQLGIGNSLNQPRPILMDRNVVFDGRSVIMTGAGMGHAGCVTCDGSLYMWGSGQFGQLGLGDLISSARVPHLIPRQVFGDSPVTMIACGADFSLVLTGNGLVWGSGDAQTGQLGAGNHVIQTHFRHIDASRFDNTPIASIAAGYNHGMALSRAGGKLWTWGLNRNGQLGHGNWDFSVSTPTLVSMNSAPGGGDFVYMDGGSDFSMAITSAGVLWSCGSGADGSLGIDIQGKSTNRFRCVWDPVHMDKAEVRMVSCGDSHTLLVTKDNVVWVSGKHGSWTETESLLHEPPCNAACFRRMSPSLFEEHDIELVSAGNETSLAVSTQGHLYIWGDHTHHAGEHLQPFKMCASEFSHVSLGRWHYLFPGHILALCMGRHRRLGSDTLYGNVDEEIFRLIYNEL